MNSAYVPLPLCGGGGGGGDGKPVVPVQLVWSANGDFALLPAKILQSKLELEKTGSISGSAGVDGGDAWLVEPRCATVVAEYSEEWQRAAGDCTRWRVQAVEGGGHFDIVLPKVRQDLARVLAEAVGWFCDVDTTT